MFGKNEANIQYSVRPCHHGATENAGMENARRSKSDAGNP